MKTKNFKHSKNAIFKACIAALKELDIDVKESDFDSGYIRGRTSTSLFSWGETIEIVVENDGNKGVRVEIESTSNAQLFSWGKNDSNEKEIMSVIKSYL